VKSEEFATAVDGQRESEVNSGEHQSAGDDERHAFAVFVIDKAEERCHQDRAEGRYRREETCKVCVYAVFHDHQFRGELQEG